MSAPHGIWAHLATAIGDTALQDFMFMGEVSGPDTTILLFKHTRTRRYLNLSREGRFYRYCVCEYEEIAKEEAIRHALS